MSFFSYGQPSQTDSLITLLEASAPNEQKLDILWQLSTHKDIDPALAITYGMQGLELAEKLKLPKRQEDFLFAVGINYHTIHDYPRSIEMAFRGLELK